MIREIAARIPGTTAKLEVIRDGRLHDVNVKLAARNPVRENAGRSESPSESRPARSDGAIGPGELGLTLVEIDESNAHRFDVPAGMTGLLVQRVEPMSAAQDAGIDRGHIILEINRQRVNSVAGMRRILQNSRSGDALAVFLYVPEIDQRNIRTVRMEPR